MLGLDLATRKVTPQLVRGHLTHGIVPLGHDIVAVADGTHRQVVIFEGRTGTVLHRIPTGDPPSAMDWHDPDALLFEAKAGSLIAVNGDSGTLALVNLRRNVVERVIRIGGKLEFAAAGRNGIVYVNVESRNELAVVEEGVGFRTTDGPKDVRGLRPVESPVQVPAPNHGGDDLLAGRVTSCLPELPQSGHIGIPYPRGWRWVSARCRQSLPGACRDATH